MCPNHLRITFISEYYKIYQNSLSKWTPKKTFKITANFQLSLSFLKFPFNSQMTLLMH